MAKPSDQTLLYAAEVWLAAAQQNVPPPKAAAKRSSKRSTLKLKPRALLVQDVGISKQTSKLSGKEKILCDECGAMVYPRQYDLERHKLKHLPRQSWPYQCQWPHCNYAAVQKSNFTRHLSDVHHSHEKPTPQIGQALSEMAAPVEQYGFQQPLDVTLAPAPSVPLFVGDGFPLATRPIYPSPPFDNSYAYCSNSFSATSAVPSQNTRTVEDFWGCRSTIASPHYEA